MTFNEAGLTLLKDFESCRLSGYLDIKGLPTIGWGHRDDHCMGETITQQQADDLLAIDVGKVTSSVKKLLTRELDDYEFSAVVCLAYNIGCEALAASNTLRLVNAGQDPTTEWLGFDHAEHVVVDGLLRRRKAELELYFTV